MSITVRGSAGSGRIAAATLLVAALAFGCQRSTTTKAPAPAPAIAAVSSALLPDTAIQQWARKPQASVSQSSNDSVSSVAALAADGNTAGAPAQTASTLTPWWQVDLGMMRSVNEVVVWGPTSGVNQLHDFYVLWSDQPFNSGDLLGTLNQPGVKVRFFVGPLTTPSKLVSVMESARYVRVQLSNPSSNAALALFEVQVQGRTNIAASPGATTSQVDNLGPVGYEANLAVDGNVNGNGSLPPGANSVAMTTHLSLTPWWQVDLGSNQPIGNIVVWNRSDCCGERLHKFYVFASANPFDPATLNKPDDTAKQPGVFQKLIPGNELPTGETIRRTSVPVNAMGRYVRIQLTDVVAYPDGEYLQLAEVEVQPVIDCPAPTDVCHAQGVWDPVAGLCTNPPLTGTACNDGNACTQTDTCQAGVCTGSNPKTCTAQDQCHTAGVCNTSTGVCTNPSKTNGVACNDGNACTQSDTCQNGACTGANPITCAAQDQCHAAGVCNSSTGVCSNPNKPNGSTCTDGNACTQSDTCQAGSCVGANPVTCATPDQCHNPGTCDTATGVCSSPAKANGSSCSDGNACTLTDTCQSGACVGASPVGCAPPDQCHQAGICDTGSGICAYLPKPNGTGCSDGNACTQSDTCQAGTCVGANPVACPAPDQCHQAGVCDVTTGSCTNAPKANGSPCSDGNACTQSDTCQAGACIGASPVTCPAPDQCHLAGTCNTATGVCSNPIKDNGTSCNDGNACTQSDGCQAGACVGHNPVVCATPDQCHTAGTCNTTTGVCSNPAKSDGTTCSDGNACTQSDTCQAGTCVGANPVTCTAPDQCHVAGTCNTTTGVCFNPPKGNGATCSDGNACTVNDSCQNGACLSGTPKTCTASDQCHTAGTCDTTSGVCSNPPVANGTTCSDNNKCTQVDTCQAGTCVGASPIVCATTDQCRTAGVCDPGTGICPNPPRPEGTPCNDGNKCTQTDTCHFGNCIGSNPVTCTALDQCHDPGTCNPSTGVCNNPNAPGTRTCNDGKNCTTADKCTNGVCGGTTVTCPGSTDPCKVAVACAEPGNGSPGGCLLANRPDGWGCDDHNLCTQQDVCQAGACVGRDPVPCAVADQCQAASTCDAATGFCTAGEKFSGNPCEDGNRCTVNDTCDHGACKPGDATACTYASYLVPITDIGSTQGQSVARDINNFGVVVGNDSPAKWPLPDPSYARTRGFMWTPNLGRVDIPSTEMGVFPMSVNDADRMAGAYMMSTGWLHPAEGNAAPNSPLVPIDADRYGVANAESLAGTTVGYGYFDDGLRAFSWNGSTGLTEVPLPDGFVDANGGGINARGEIVGTGERDDDSTGAFYSAPIGTYDLDHINVIAAEGGAWRFIDAKAINDDGYAVGWGFHDDHYRAYLLAINVDGTSWAFDLGLPPTYTGDLQTTGPVAHDINKFGEIVGAIYDFSDDWAYQPHEAFVWTPRDKMIDLNTLIDPLSGWHLVAAYGINDKHEIVGLATHNGQARGFKLTLQDTSPCTPQDSCHEVPARDPDRGNCPATSPQLADETPCHEDGTFCPDNNICIAGVCGGYTNVCLRADGVIKGEGDKRTALFGYDSEGDVTATPTPNFVAIDGQAVWSAGPPAPLNFEPGARKPASFLPTFEAGHTISWRVGGQKVSASDKSDQRTLTTAANGDQAVSVFDNHQLLTVTVKPNLKNFTDPPPEPAQEAEPEVGADFNGALAGKLDVSPSGAAMYTLPIVIPPGIAGMVPNLTLTYSSQAGDGIAGQGWDLTGTSMIHRCPRNWVQDGAYRPMTLADGPDGDGICLDGKRLFEKADGGYYAEANDFSTITYVADSHKYKIVTKSGEVHYYGSTSTSRVSVPYISGAASEPESRVVVWALDRVVDKWGNYFDLQYNEGKSDFQTEGIRLTSIRYTGHTTGRAINNIYVDTGLEDEVPPFRTIELGYETRSDVRTIRFGSAVLPRKYRLSTIDTQIGKYTLNYRTPAANSPEAVLLPSQLRGIKYCINTSQDLPEDKRCIGDVDGTKVDELFQWNTDNNGSRLHFGDLNGNPELAPASNNPQDQTYQVPATDGMGRFVDINGDGRPEYTTIGTNDNWPDVWENNGQGWTQRTDWAPPTAALVDKNDNWSWTSFADVDGDGLPDLVSPSAKGPLCGTINGVEHCIQGSATPAVWLNRVRTGEGWVFDASFSNPPGWNEPAGFLDMTQGHTWVMDMNGDGMGDLVHFGAPGEGQNPYVDRRGDMIEIYYGKGAGLGWDTSGFSYWQTPWGSDPLQPADAAGLHPRDFHMEDLNSDGLPDLVSNSKHGSPAHYIAYINSINTWPQWTHVALDKFPGEGAPSATPFVGDLDGDGIRDAVEYSIQEPTDHCTNGPNGRGPVCNSRTPPKPWQISFGTGFGFTGEGPSSYLDALTKYAPTFADLIPRVGEECSCNHTGFRDYNGAAGDLNGDGLADYVINFPDGGRALINDGLTWRDINGFTEKSDSAGDAYRRIPLVPTPKNGGSFIDVNGDGVVDIVRLDYEPDSVTVRGPAIARAIFGSWVDSSVPTIKIGSDWHTWLNHTEVPVITHFPTGLDGGAYVKHVVITSLAAKEQGVYADTAPLAPGTKYATSPLRVVSSVSRDDGIGGTSTVLYHYESLRSSRYGRGSQGFQSMRVLEPNGLTTTTKFAQAYPYTGLPISVQKAWGPSKPRVRAVAYTETEYCDAAIDDDTQPACTPMTGLVPTSANQYGIKQGRFVYPKKVTDTTSTWKDKDTLASTITTTSTFRYDTHGNVRQSKVQMAGSNGESYQTTTDNKFGDPGSTEESMGQVTETKVRTEKLAPVDKDDVARTHTTRFEYGVVAASTSAPDESSEYRTGLKKRIIEPGGGLSIEAQTVYAYDKYGNVTGTTECASDFDTCFVGAPGPDLPDHPQRPRFRTTRVSYDPADFVAPSGSNLVTSINAPKGMFPVKTTNALGQSEYTAYDGGTGALVQRTGPNGITECHTFSLFGHPRNTVARCGSDQEIISSTRLAMNKESNYLEVPIVKVTRPAGAPPVWEFTDRLGRVRETRTRAFNGGFIQSGTTSYDQFGRVDTETKPRFNRPDAPVFKITHQYDFFSRPKSVTQDLGQLDPNGPTNVTSTVTTKYLGMTLETDTEVNGETRTRQETKNLLGKADTITDAAGNTIHYRYDADGNLRWTTDPNNNQVQLLYDQRGRKYNTIDPDQGSWSYAYDAWGELVYQKDAKQQETYILYDRLGRSTGRQDARGLANWTYDRTDNGAGIGKIDAVSSVADEFLTSNGQPCTIRGIEAAGNRTGRWYDYDSFGQTTDIFECIDGDTFQTSFTYDEFGRQSTVTYPKAGDTRLSIDYHYGATGHLRYITDHADGQVYWAADEADALGQITKEHTRNGVTTTGVHNQATGWLVESAGVAGADGNTLIQHWAYAYDEAGNVLRRTRSNAINAGELTEAFGYDTLDRLTASTLNSGPSESVSYDSLGNITEKGGKTYSYGTCLQGPHAVCGVGDSLTFSYDSNGSMTSGSGRYIQYNAINKVRHIETSRGFVNYLYGADGNRVVQSLQANSEQESRTVYVGMGGTGKSLYERTTHGWDTEHVMFLYAAGAHSGNAFAIKTVKENSGLGSSSTQTRYYHFDHLGSVTAMSDEAGHVADDGGSLSYDAWGARRNLDGTAGDGRPFDAQPGRREFTGHEAISIAGLVNMNGRIYDPILGRFLSADPNIQFASNLQSYNRYAYVQNNPLKYTDPTGYFINKWFDMAVNIGFAVAAVVCPECAPMLLLMSMAYNTASALNAGATFKQIIVQDIVAIAASYVGGAFGSLVPVTGVGTAMVSGAISGATAAAFTSVVMGDTGHLGQNVLMGAAQSAAMAGLAWKGHQLALSKATKREMEEDVPNHPETQRASRSSRYVLVLKLSGLNPSGEYYPVPKDMLGTCEYYEFRYTFAPDSYIEDEGPEYFLDFGRKNCEKFTEIIDNPNASPALKAFAAKTRLELQLSLESAIADDPQIQMKRSSLGLAAFDTHPDAYRRGGFGNLSLEDQFRVFRRIDMSDLFGYGVGVGLRQFWNSMDMIRPYEYIAGGQMNKLGI